MAAPETQTPPGAVVLPDGAYTDPDLYRLEQQRLLWASWVSVARLEDLAEPGDYVTFDHAGEPLLVVRGRDDVLRAFPNLCRHRPTTLMEGCGRARSLQCPYHLWTYDLAGHLVGAPDMDRVEGFSRDDWGLPELSVETWGGWVFVHLDPEPPPLRSQLAHLDATYASAYLERLVRVGHTVCHSPWNWKVVVENFIESYHHAGVHPKTLQVPFPYQKLSELDSQGEAWGSLEHTSTVDSLEPFTATSVYPTHLFAIQRPFGMSWFKLEPKGVGAVEIDIQVFVIPELADNEEVAQRMLAGLETVNDEDVRINARTWKGLHSRFAKMGPMSPYEEGLRRFRRWWLERMG